MGMKASGFFCNLKFQKLRADLHLLGYYSWPCTNSVYQALSSSAHIQESENEVGELPTQS